MTRRPAWQPSNGGGVSGWEGGGGGRGGRNSLFISQRGGRVLSIGGG